MSANDFIMIAVGASFALTLTMGCMVLWLVHESSKTRAAMSGYVAALAHSSRVADFGLSTYDDPYAFQSAIHDFSRIMRRADRSRTADFNDFWRMAA